MPNEPTKQNICKVYWVKEAKWGYNFPDITNTAIEPDGLLAIGGDLTEERLLTAYEQGLFPWFNEEEPVLWWSPDPRCIIYPSEIKISRSLSKCIRKKKYEIRYNSAFLEVLNCCANTRENTWISDNIKKAYARLFELGYAHSLEYWQEGKLVGGLYGLAMGKIFFGESMFSLVPNASKILLVDLAQQLEKKDFCLIDCQVASSHLLSMGARLIEKKIFKQILNKNCNRLKITNWL